MYNIEYLPRSMQSDFIDRGTAGEARRDTGPHPTMFTCRRQQVSVSIYSMHGRLQNRRLVPWNAGRHVIKYLQQAILLLEQAL